MKKFPSAFFVVPIYEGSNKCKKRKRLELILDITIDRQKFKGKIMAISLRDTQFAEVELQVVDKKGFLTSVDEGSVVFSSSDESVFTVEEDPDNDNKAKIVAVAPGVAQLDYSADADLGDGTKTIEGFTAVEVLPGDAVGFGIRVTNVAEQEDATTTSTTESTTVEESTTTTTTEESTSSSTTETSTEASTTETTTEPSTTETTTEASTTETSTTEETTATTEETTAVTEETTTLPTPEEPIV